MKGERKKACGFAGFITFVNDIIVHMRELNSSFKQTLNSILIGANLQAGSLMI